MPPREQDGELLGCDAEEFGGTREISLVHWWICVWAAWADYTPKIGFDAFRLRTRSLCRLCLFSYFR